MKNRVLICVIAVAMVWAIPGAADTVVLNATHIYGGVDINVVVTNQGSDFLWQYIVTNHSYNPNPGTSNGFAGFELNLPIPVADIANITDPGPGWIHDCCSGHPVEWDLTNSSGLGVMPGSSGTFSFTTDPRPISLSSGWYHTWQNNGQTDLVFYTSFDSGLEAPNVLAPPIPVPEPGSMALLGTGSAGSCGSNSSQVPQLIHERATKQKSRQPAAFFFFK